MTAPGGMAVLLIEDDPLHRKTLESMLERLGCRVELAGNGREGIAALRDSTPDLVITDIIMPEQEGIETILEIRRLWPGLKVIAISGGGAARRMDFLEIARRLGADGTLAKPFRLTELRRMIEQVTGMPLTPKF